MMDRLIAAGFVGLSLVACDPATPARPVDDPEGPSAPALEVETQPATSCTFSKLPLCQGRTCFCPNGVSGLPAAWLTGGREPITPAPFDRVASASHWVGYIVQGTDTCPLPAETRGGAWQVQRPFATASAVPELQRFCEYTWAPAEGTETPPAIEALPDVVADPVDPTRNPIFRLEPDLEAAIPAGEPVPEAAWRPLEAAFLEQVDVSVWGGMTTLASRADAPVRVAIVDAAQAGDEGVYDRPYGSTTGHADIVGSIIDRLVCPPDDGAARPAGCAAQIRNALALRNVDRDALAPLVLRQPGDLFSFATGGEFGRVHDIATALFEVVRAWQRDRACDPVDPACRPGRKLIVNLSLGWSKEFGGSAVNTMRVPVRAAYLAAREARCQGALLVASAGNRGEKRRGGAGTTEINGALYPAAWEKLAPGACPLAADEYMPLVYAVGGVTGEGAPLGNARPASLPRLLAPGENAALLNRADDRDIGVQGTLPATGSSVSAAVVSGLAAVVWAIRPELSPDAVMALLYGNGLSTGRPAELYRRLTPDGTKYPQRVVSFCRSLLAACEDGVARDGCPTPELRARIALSCRQDAFEPLTADMDVVLDAAYADWFGTPVAPEALRRLTTAENTALETAGLAAASDPAAFPQPGYTTCPLCTVGAPGAAPALERLFTGRLQRGPDDQTTVYASAKLTLKLQARNAALACPAEVNLGGAAIAPALSFATFKIPFRLGALGLSTVSEQRCKVTGAQITLTTQSGVAQVKENVTVVPY